MCMTNYFIDLVEVFFRMCIIVLLIWLKCFLGGAGQMPFKETCVQTRLFRADCQLEGTVNVAYWGMIALRHFHFYSILLDRGICCQTL